MSNSQLLRLPDSNQGPLSVRFTSTDAFPQTGTWSWSDMMTKLVSSGVAVLARYSAGGVDPFTVIVGQAICRNFELGRQGTKRLQSILETLPSHSTMGNVLHFGFGVNSIVRTLSSTYEGGILIAIVASATECYSIDHVVDIIWEMVELYKQSAPEEMTPSPMQWKAVVKQCAGAFSRCEFPKIAEQLMSLHPRDEIQSGELHHFDYLKRSRYVSTADSLAEALVALGQITQEKLEAVVIKGGPDGGWLAAFAHWFLNLRVSIYDSEGSILYTNHNEGETFQVQFVFSGIRSAQESTDDMQITEKVYHLRDSTEIFRANEMTRRWSAPSSRVPWDQALSTTFGVGFKQLMEQKRIVGTILGSAARIFEGVCNAEESIDRATLRAHLVYSEGSQGKTFIIFATDRFPELMPLYEQMQKALILSYEDAFAAYDAGIENLKQACSCDSCMLEGRAHSRQGFCLALITEAVINLVRCLSGVLNTSDLLPARLGIESFYWRQRDLSLSITSGRREPKKSYSRLDWCFGARSHTSVGTTEETAVPRLVQAVRLFAGRKVEKYEHYESAITLEGICGYLRILDGVTDDPGSLGLCAIMPGQIEMAGRTYNYIHDMSDLNGMGLYYKTRRNLGTVGRLGSPEDLRCGYSRVSMKAHPSMDALHVGLFFQADSSDGHADVLVGPAKVTRDVLSASGLVHCPHASTMQGMIRQDTEHDECEIEVVQIPSSSLPKVWTFKGNILSRMVAMARIGGSRKIYNTIWTRGECLDCCQKSVPRTRDTVIIAPKLRF